MTTIVSICSRPLGAGDAAAPWVRVDGIRAAHAAIAALATIMMPIARVVVRTPMALIAYSAPAGSCRTIAVGVKQRGRRVQGVFVSV